MYMLYVYMYIFTYMFLDEHELNGTLTMQVMDDTAFEIGSDLELK